MPDLMTGNTDDFMRDDERPVTDADLAAEALDLLVELYRAYPALDNLLNDEHHARLLALVEGK